MKPSIKKFLKIVGVVAGALILLSVGMLAGFLTRDWVNDKPYRPIQTEAAKAANLPKDFDLNLMADVIARIRSRFVDHVVACDRKDGKIINPEKCQATNGAVTDRELFYGAMSGLVHSLKDPYSIYLDPQEARDFGDELEGSFTGIGAEIGIRKEHVVVITPLLDSPAERAGLHSGDIIAKINDKDTTDMSLDEAVHLIRGPERSVVRLLVVREEKEHAREIEFNITRARIILKNVQWRLLKLEEKPGIKGDVVLLTLSNFNVEVARKFPEMVQAILLKNPAGIIFDMRNNPGGLLDVAIEVASYWVPQGESIVIEKMGSNREVSHPSSGSGSFEHVPTVILVNEGTASAAEIVAGALEDHGKAKLVGVRTFGKGSVQDLESLPDGSTLRLTIAKWFTPKRRQIDGAGLPPDYVVERTDDDLTAGRDPQLAKAIELLKSQ